MRETEEFIFFWKTRDIYSQWHSSVFHENDIKFICAEQYMMYRKALYFHDDVQIHNILGTSNPKLIKKYGRTVKGYVDHIWNGIRQCIVYQGNYLKFSQNPELLKQLLATSPKILVEASPHDMIWGIGYDQDHPAVTDISLWKGQNLLGYTITQLRNDLLCHVHTINE